MKKRATLALSLLLTTALLAGCASGGGETASSATAETTAQENGTIEVYNGTMPLPEDYDNFVVLTNTLVEDFLALGVTPTAAAIAEEPTADTDTYSVKYYHDGPERVYADYNMTSIDRLPTQLTDDLEAILALKPDFIVASDSYEQYLEKFEAIAPTYLIPSSFDAAEGEEAWMEKHRLIGKLVGKEAEAEANIDDYKKFASDYQSATADKTDGKTALVLQLNPKGFKVRMAEEQPVLYKELGLATPEGLSSDLASTSVTDENGAYPIEMLAPFDPDYIFIDIQSEEDFETIKNSPIWQNLKAVKNGNVMEISHFVWVQSEGPISKRIQLKDAADFITDGTVVTSNPFIV